MPGAQSGNTQNKKCEEFASNCPEEINKKEILLHPGGVSGAGARNRYRIFSLFLYPISFCHFFSAISARSYARGSETAKEGGREGGRERRMVYP